MWPDRRRVDSQPGPAQGTIEVNIDPAIRQLVDRMNATGSIRTIGSCQGHVLGGRPPYVYFQTSVEVAAAIERRLRNAVTYDDALLHFTWAIEGLFDDDFALRFLLYAPALHRGSGLLFNPYVLSYVSRSALDGDLLSLGGIVEEAVLLNLGKDAEPKVSCAASNHD